MLYGQNLQRLSSRLTVEKESTVANKVKDLKGGEVFQRKEWEQELYGFCKL